MSANNAKNKKEFIFIFPFNIMGSGGSYKIGGVIFAFLFFFFLWHGYASAAVLSRAPNNLGLVGYWPLNEGVGTRAGDFSGKGNHGTLTQMDAATDWGCRQAKML
jgi:hypothetical protein